MIIGISGKKQHGKDTVAQMLQIILQKEEDSKEGYLTWDTKRFADKLKQMVCLLLGCTMKQLEDHKFKEAPLGEEWRVWYWSHYKYPFDENCRISRLHLSKEECEGERMGTQSMQEYFGSASRIESYILTPRKLLQILGTEAGRKLIHPNIWVNALMADYKDHVTTVERSAIGRSLGDGTYTTGNNPSVPKEYHDMIINNREFKWYELITNTQPNWIITDVRFPNEAEAIKKRGGIVLRVNRLKRTSHEWQVMFPKIKVLDPDGWNRQDFHNSWNVEHITLEEYKNRVSISTCEGIMIGLDAYYQLDKHESETALDNYQYFDAIIKNDSNLASLESQLHTIQQIQQLKP